MGLGYYTNTGEVIRTMWREDTEDILFNRTLPSTRFFNMEHIRKLFNEDMSGKKDHGKLLYGLIVFEIWYELFMEGKKPGDIKASFKS
jgi:hypothetical protein